MRAFPEAQRQRGRRIKRGVRLQKRHNHLSTTRRQQDQASAPTTRTTKNSSGFNNFYCSRAKPQRFRRRCSSAQANRPIGSKNQRAIAFAAGRSRSFSQPIGPLSADRKKAPPCRGETNPDKQTTIWDCLYGRPGIFSERRPASFGAVAVAVRWLRLCLFREGPATSEHRPGPENLSREYA